MLGFTFWNQISEVCGPGGGFYKLVNPIEAGNDFNWPETSRQHYYCREENLKLYAFMPVCLNTHIYSEVISTLR